MTREEAVKILKRNRLSYDEQEADKFCEAYDMAISALEQEPCDEWQNGYDIAWEEAKVFYEQEPCDDAISREAVKNEIKCWIGSGEYRKPNATDNLGKRIRDLPSVQPSQNKRCEWGRMTYDYISKDIIFDFSDGTEKRVSRADQENVITLSRGEYDRLKALQPSRKGQRN